MQQKNSTHRIPQKTRHVNSTPSLRALLSTLFIGTKDNVPGTLPLCLLNPRVNSFLLIHLLNKCLFGTHSLISTVIDTEDRYYGQQNGHGSCPQERGKYAKKKKKRLKSMLLFYISELSFDPIFQVRKV